MKICVCGGGNLGHAAAGFIAAREKDEVRILTRHPERWSANVTVWRPDGDMPVVGRLAKVSDRPDEVVADADVVLLCLPGFSIREVLLSIRDYLSPECAVGSVVCSTGFFFEAMQLLPATTPLFGFQRVPFIARTVEYGHLVQITGYKPSLSMAVEQTYRKEELRQLSERMFNTPTCLLDSYYEVSLSNSNPLLHPARLYDLWNDWREGMVYPSVPLFYEEWTERAAQLYIDMDGELQQLLHELHVKGIPSVFDYYESSDASSLARKLRSITAFKGILAPMKAVEGGYQPDVESRYFTEDFPYGLAIARRLAHEKGIHTPTMDRVYEWGTQLIKPQPSWIQ